MIASWEPEPVPRPELPRCGAAKQLRIPDGDGSSVDECCSCDDSTTPLPDSCLPDGPDWANDTSAGGAEGDPIEAGVADTSAATGSFGQLLKCLAAEHRRALAQLRTQLEATVATSPDGATATENETRADAAALPPRRSSRRSKESGEPEPGGMRAKQRRQSVVRRTASTRLSPFDFVSEDERGGRRRSSEAVGEVLTEMPQALGSEMSSTGSIRLETRQTAKRASMGDIVPRCVQSQTFDTLSGALILLNSVMLGWAADISVENSLRGNPPDDMPKTFKVMTISFTSWFTMELLLRACAVGPRKFFSNEDRMWNIFDSMTVGTDIVHTLLEITSDGSAAMQNLTVVRMLRIMRITRAIRMVRLIRFFRELRMMVFSVLKSGSSLLWSLLLLITTIYIFGIYFVQVVAYHLYLTEAPPEETPEFGVYKTTKEMFGSLLRSVYTLYQAVSGGISWGEIGSVLIGIAPVHGFVLCFFTFFTTFALLNIITGIFVDSSINSAQNDKDEVIQEQLHQQNSALSEMQKLFQLADKDGSGSMDLDEFEEHLQSKEVRAHFLSLGIEVDKVKGLFRLLDLDMSGELSLEEFVQGCTRLRGPAKSIDLATLMNEYMRMSDDLQRFFSWSDGQFNRLYHFQVRLEKRLDGLFTDEV
mmetsp:Transcript_43165/g.124655  ORF Transcript_43165/g.124655 Transcript_43165/m.124655 type:complete len:647 (+) Transcript_43165:180-2120(+)